MTDAPRHRKLSISVPPDVADRLDAADNASALVVDAVRHRMRLEQLDALLAERGITVTPEGVTQARARRAAVEAEWTPQRWQHLRDRSRNAAAASMHPPAGQAPAA